MHSHPSLTAKQVQFLNLLQAYISEYGGITIDKLYESPFDRLAPNGLDGIFAPEDVTALVQVLQPFVKTINRATDCLIRMSCSITLIKPCCYWNCYADWIYSKRYRQTVGKILDRGITNPLTVIEQISYLMFSRMLDMQEDVADRKSSTWFKCNRAFIPSNT